MTTFTAIQRGDTIGYFVGKEGGERFAPVYSVNEHAVEVKTSEGRKVIVAINKARLVNDGRMNMLRILDFEDAGEARNLREAYLADWDVRIEDYKSQFQTEDEEGQSVVARRGRKAVAADGSLVEQIVSVVTTKKVATKGDIIKAIGTEPTASEWKKAVDEALRTGRIASQGVRRGTKYTLPGVEIERSVPVEDTDVTEYATKVENFIFPQGRVEGGWSRAQITEALPTDNGTYQAAMKSLVASGKIIKTGAKRGTRYHIA